MDLLSPTDDGNLSSVEHGRCLSAQMLGGYLYFHKAPNPQEFFEETRDKVRTPLCFRLGCG